MDTNQESLMGAIKVEGSKDTNNVIQKGQCLGWLFPLLNVKSNKVFNSYFVFCSLDFTIGLNHLKESALRGFSRRYQNGHLSSQKTNMMLASLEKNM